MTDRVQMFIDNCVAYFGDRTVTKNAIKLFGATHNNKKISWKFFEKFRVGDDYCFSAQPSTASVPVEPQVDIKEDAEELTIVDVAEVVEVVTTVKHHSMVEEDISFVPDIDETFIPYGISSDIDAIIKTRKFFPVYVTGETGIGKTLAVIQCCAKHKRELIRFNVTNDTDESDLFGDFRLIDGSMIFAKGPVLEAMERGAVLLLDELSAGNPNKLLSLQSVLEGKGVFLKKIGLKVEHADGFTVIATDNSKGKGSVSGRYLGLNVLNEAFLDRFVVTMSHTYPSKAIEKKILMKYCSSNKIVPNMNFIDTIANWAEIIRKTFEAEGCTEVISTRRLVNVYKVYSVFDDVNKAIEMSINRFDDETIQAFTSLFSKLLDEEKGKEHEKAESKDDGVAGFSSSNLPDDVIQKFTAQILQMNSSDAFSFGLNVSA